MEWIYSRKDAHTFESYVVMLNVCNGSEEEIVTSENSN